MNNKGLFYLKKINIAKILALGCIFLFAFLFTTVKVDALGTINILSSTYSGNGNDTDAVTIGATTGEDGSVTGGIKYIQGSGISNYDGITFEITNMYTTLNDFTAFAIWESSYSDSSQYPDYDRWYLRTIVCDDENCTNFTSVENNNLVVKYEDENEEMKVLYNEVVANGKVTRYYIEQSASNVMSKNGDPDFVNTVVDFSKFFTDKKITYTYRIRNANYANSEDHDGFGYKELEVNYWRASDGTSPDVNFASQVIQFGLAKAISDVEAYTNNTDSDKSTNNPIVCASYLDYICVDYVDTNGEPSASTTEEKQTNIYIPDNVLYAHSSTTREDVINNYDDNDKVDMNYVVANNTLYGLNYFCEGDSIEAAVITYDSNKKHSAACSAGLRQYLYVDSTLVGNDIDDEGVVEFVNKATSFVTSPYQVKLTVDTRGSYVVVIRDVFGNTNEAAIIKVTDIINQALIAYFEKSNKTTATVVESDGWKADEYLTDEDVTVTITMTATTVIEQGLPIISATTTLLDSKYIKHVYFWRVDGSQYTSDICEGDEHEGCAIKPNEYTVLYSSGQTPHDSFLGFELNKISLTISSNGRYRFYIETFAGNNTDENVGEKKNPRVEIYKIDKQAPEILFGGSNNTYCNGNSCKYVEETYAYYQGTGNVSGSIVNNLASGSEGASTKIVYSPNGIYYVSADNKNPLLASASVTADIFFDSFYALLNSGTYINESINYYGNKTNDVYAYFYTTAANEGGLKYVKNNTTLSTLTTETAYREYIISNNIEYTAFSLAVNSDITLKEGELTSTQQGIIVEYYDAASSDTLVCDKISSLKIDLNGDNEIDENDCVNYYLDHGIDFKIKITAYDVVQDNEGNYILGNKAEKIIDVDVQDTTTPGFNKIIENYNVGSDCRIEIGNVIGIDYQTMDKLLECYKIVSDAKYNFEDNVFNEYYTQNQTVNNRNHISMYILSKETNEWVSLDTEDGYTPNRSGKYSILIIIRDDASTTTTFNFGGKTYDDVTVKAGSKIDVNGNAIATVISYYVDKKLVLIAPESNEKDYGSNDPVFEYCVYVNSSNEGIASYLEAPFANMEVFGSALGCTSGATLTENELKLLFKGNVDIASFTGKLNRQESADYNNTAKYGKIGNEYVGLYKIVLGSLNIEGTAADGYDIGADYIIKIDPRVRNADEQLVSIEGTRKDQNQGKCNLVNSYIPGEGEDPISGCYGFKEDDDYFVESTATLTIKQVILTIKANGSSKYYGEKDPNYDKANSNTALSALQGAAAYLKGYTIEGLKNSDTYNVVLGVLRREVGEDVGIYSICNYRGMDYLDTVLENSGTGVNNMLIVGASGSSDYKTCSAFDTYANTTVNTGKYVNGIIQILEDEEENTNFIKSRALYIKPNTKNGFYKTLNALPAGDVNTRNNNYANYVINYKEGIFEINPSTLVVQPTPGQRREYSYSGVDEVNPWEVVVYGSKTFAVAASGAAYTGYTENSPTYTALSNDPKSVDEGNVNSGTKYYNNASEERDVWNLILNDVLYTGFKTNETYSLFASGTRISLKGWSATDGVFLNMNAGWYDYNELTDSTLDLITNGRKQCSYSNYISSVGVTNTGDCRNYNLVIDLDYRNVDGYKNGDTDEDGNTVSVTYKSKMGYCKATGEGTVSDPSLTCSNAQSTKILFEVYRREIILEFNSLLEKIPSNNVHMVYGYRYDYYFENLFNIDDDTSDDYLENKLFYCYASYEDGLVGLSGECSTNEWYGLTKGDSWARVGLEFYLHKLVSATDSGYYSSENDNAIPAGRYYVYSKIGDNTNYKYNYLGGTMTIKTKVVNIELTDYEKEYGNVYYTNVTCLKDGSILNANNSLISDCEDVTNTNTNTYGFVIDGLDSKDTISDNFNGRPIRDSNLENSSKIYTDTNGLQENVGIYTIRVGSIHSKNNNTFNSCDDKFIGSELSNCVVVSGVDINNYITGNDAEYTLTYYLLKNGTEENGKDYASTSSNSIVNKDDMQIKEASLTITPATIDITVTGGQTKMYGCAYNSVNTTSVYNYTYGSGYDCTTGTGSNYDLGYEYTVSGDKDFYIYNNGYYDTNYDFDTTYTSSKINMISNGAVHSSLLTGNSSAGLRSSALNGGVLYRINSTSYTNSGISYSDLIGAADKVQNLTHYQGQSVGSYIITLGNLNASLTSDYDTYNEENNKFCDANNMPSASGSEVCRNYIINYYGNKSTDATHTYDTTEDDIIFTITRRVAFIYALYNSKVYGNADPVVSRVCDQDMINAGFCSTLNETITYGISYYYTKYNSLAKAPWVASIENDNTSDIYFATTSVNDVQTDVVSGPLSRIGMNNGDKTKDDIVGTYNYLFDDVVKTSYADNNYNLNYYYRELSDGKIVISNGSVDDTKNPYIKETVTGYNQYQAVNENGGNTQVVDSETKNVLFEINLRKITVTLISFSKVYGIEDNSLYYDLGVCATDDEVLTYDEKGNPLCSYKEGVNSTEHGLSPTHKGLYLNDDNTLKQTQFKNAFKVTYLRSTGENVVCPNNIISGTLSGYFPNKATTYSYSLGCSNNAYEALGVINQASGELGYNYEITYVKGTMDILTRTILVTPDSDQGFQYGSYTYPTLIPAITFTNELKNADYTNSSKKVVSYNLENNVANVVILNRDETTTATGVTTNNLGLVNSGSGAICLKNIDKNDEHTFCINDRQDTYNTGDDETTTSSFSANLDGSASDAKATYVFGDVYTSESSSRHALNRKLSSATDERYNRNVGVYTITIGDLVDNDGLDKTGNYKVEFTEGVSYTITAADLEVTPISGKNNAAGGEPNADGEDQSKVYGEADKEIEFIVRTTYTINTTQYIVADQSIITIGEHGVNYYTPVDGKIKVEAGTTIVLAGYAYYENSVDGDNKVVQNYNYGVIKNNNKSSNAAGVSQTGISGKSYDKYCYDNYDDNSTVAKGAIDGCSNQTITFETSTKILIGYLYVTGYNQKAGTHLIAVDGIVVAKNTFGVKNYNLSVASDITFEIKKLDINLAISSVSKTYGQATDGYKCEDGADCTTNFATLNAQDNEKMLEYNFNISYKDSANIISAADYNGESKVLMVNAINGNYYTQSEGEEDKNNFLGVSVIRKVNNDVSCSIDSDEFGCEDVGSYTLSFRKVEVKGTTKDGSDRYDDNYNLMFNNTNVTVENINNDYVVVDPTSHDVVNASKVDVIKEISSTLIISKRSVDIFVNTNLNDSEANYYEIEQNIEAPNLPVIDNNYNLIGYKYDGSKQYHGLGENASSSSDNTDLDETYTKIVWGDKPKQVRTADALVGSVAYCNEASNGNAYSDTYPGMNTLCSDSSKLVYNDNKAKVNTNTKNKFILITRDAANEAGLKILSNSGLSADNNTYEEKNYNVSFYPGAIHVIGDSSDPTMVIGNKDYYIEANASVVDNDIVGSISSIGAILEYLFNGTDTAYILAHVDADGNLAITINNVEIDITQSSLYSTYGNGNESYPGIVSGVEQTSIYPFVSDYAHIASGNDSYLNETNIKTLQQLITTFVKWFNVESYDSGQYINGQYLQRKFDKYYYVAINKFGYDIAGDVDNLFAINKVGTYTVSFYVMDNAGRVSSDGNTAKLHIIDTTAPTGGELNLYSAAVSCDADCNKKDKWYIKEDKVRLALFNKYRYDEASATYILDSSGEYIYYTEIGNDTSPYKKISDLSENITTENYIDYLDTSDVKYSAEGIRHYNWSSNPDGIFLTITGGSDNSYTFAGNSSMSQWKHHYSIDGGFYWMEYELAAGMDGYSAMISDGYRTIMSATIDSGVNKVSTNKTYVITYEACYDGCEDIEIINKVDINNNTYSFSINDINNKYFAYDASTTCVINKLSTFITCTIKNEGQPDLTKTIKLEGNKFTYEGINYILAGDSVLTTAGEFKASLVKETITLNGVTYRYDSSAMKLYRDYIGELGIVTESGRTLTIDGEVYTIVGSEVLKGGVKVSDIEDYSFVIAGLTYHYIDGVSKEYYLATESYDIYQDSFKIGAQTYNISSFDASKKYVVNKDTLKLIESNNYTTTYELYDKYLVGVDTNFTDRVEAEEASVFFRINTISNVGWNKASSDEGATNIEVSNFLGVSEETKYYKDKKVAYLDTTAPLIGLSMNTVINNETVNVRYGDDWYTYEYGYFNMYNLAEELTYSLNGVNYKVDKDNMVVVDVTNNKNYEIKASGLEDANKKYVYYINYTNFYLDEEFTTVRWLYSYRERFVGGKDDPDNKGVSQVEVKYYNINNSIFMGKIDPEDVFSEYILITNNTNTTTSSGLGSDKYANNGKSSTLFDFVYMNQYEQGIYHEDIDYIVWYYDNDGDTVKIELDDEFEECYLKDGKVTQDCAQEAISNVVSANNGNGSKDIVYNINYVIRDKAGNASTYAARGAIYATILPSTNVIINNVEATPTNSAVTVVDLGNDTYSMEANQGVSLSLLDEAFSVDYSTTRKSYNSNAVMTIYRDDEVIASNVSGVSFTKYINSDDIADYTIVYNMKGVHTTALGDEVEVEGKTVTLHLSIKAPVVDTDSEVTIDSAIKNDSSYVLIFIILGFISVIGVGIVLIVKRKN